MRLLLCALLITSNAIACDYESDDLIQYEGHIESVRVIDKKVYPYVEDTRICTMRIESRVKQRPHRYARYIDTIVIKVNV